MRPLNPTGHALRALALALLLALAGAAWAQDAETVGTIEGTVNGEPMTWYLLAMDTPEGPQSTATWSSIMGVMYDLSLQAHPEPTFVIEDALSLNFSLMALPSGCPCTYGPNEVEVLYWTTSSMFGDLHSSVDGGTAEATLTTFEEIEEGVYRLEGTFSAEMPYVEGIGAEPDTENVAVVEGAFTVERLPELVLDLP